MSNIGPPGLLHTFPKLRPACCSSHDVDNSIHNVVVVAVVSVRMDRVV